MVNSPVIRLPEGPERVAQLQRKLEEYKGRLNPMQHPDLQVLSDPDTTHKIAVLEALLRDKQVVTHDLCRELANKWGQRFDGYSFNNACAVIDDYCQTGGEHAVGGTGLR